MSKKYSVNSKLIKRSRKTFKKVLIFFLCIVEFFVLFLGGIFISNLITGAQFNFFQTNKITIKSVNYYALSFGDFTDEYEAKKCSTWVSASGGAAYQYGGNSLDVIGQIYLNIDDAENVKNGFNNDLMYGANIRHYKTKTTHININKLTTDDRNSIEHDINQLNATIKNVLKISNNLDKNEVSKIVAGSELNLLKSKIKLSRLDIERVNSNYEKVQLNKLKEIFLIFEDSLDMCVTNLLTSENYYSVCKYCACELFFNYYDFFNNFAT